MVDQSLVTSLAAAAALISIGLTLRRPSAPWPARTGRQAGTVPVGERPLVSEIDLELGHVHVALVDPLRGLAALHRIHELGALDRLGRVGVLGSGSIGSACSIWSVGSFASYGSTLSARSRWSALSDRSDDAVLGSREAHTRAGGLRAVADRGRRRGDCTRRPPAGGEPAAASVTAGEPPEGAPPPGRRGAISRRRQGGGADGLRRAPAEDRVERVLGVAQRAADREDREAEAGSSSATPTTMPNSASWLAM